MDMTIPWTASMVDFEDSMFDGILLRTEKLEISSSIRSLFVVGEWIFSANPSMFEIGIFNIGRKINFTFYPPGDESISIHLSILTVNDGPGSSVSLLGGLFSLKLISPWYFDQLPLSKAYRGTTSDVIAQLIAEELSNSFNSTSITQTYDDKKIRYRTLQKVSTFLEKRVVPYMKGQDNSASFLFTNDKNDFELLDYPSLMAYPEYIALDYTSTIKNNYHDELLDKEKSKQFFYPQSMIFNINNTEEADLWDLRNAALIYLNRPDLSIHDEQSTENALKPLMMNSTNKFSPIVPDIISTPLVSRFIINDNLEVYDDIYSKTINEVTKRLMKGHQIDLVGFPNLWLKVGRPMLLEIETVKESNVKSVFSQKVPIATISHVFKQSQCMTYITCEVPAFQYTDKNSVVPFFTA
jgi:hypothetical protein